MSSLKCFPCRVCFLVISLIYHHLMECFTFTVTMSSFFFSGLLLSLSNDCHYKHPFVSHWTILPSYRGVEVRGINRTLQKSKRKWYFQWHIIMSICLFIIKEDPVPPQESHHPANLLHILLEACSTCSTTEQHHTPLNVLLLVPI